MRHPSTLLILILLLLGCRSETHTAAEPSKMPTPSKFVFDGHEYRIVTGQITASIGDPYWCDTYNDGNGKAIAWSIHFSTESDDEELSPPNVDFDGIQIDVPNWHDLVGYSTRWGDAINIETDDRYGMVYVYDHQLISNGSVQITARDGKSFLVEATGQNEQGQRFTIVSPAEFMGIYVRGSEKDSDETIRARLKQYLDDVNLTGTPFMLEHEYGSGVKMGQSFYFPKTD